MPSALTTTVTELPASRVRVEVQVPSDELEGHVERAARRLGRELKLPGFRRGHVPDALVIQRVGRATVLEQAVRDTLSQWYADAVAAAGIVPVGDPELELGELPPPGEALAFSIEIGVLPRAQLGSYQGLEVGRREPAVADEQIERELEALRERLARLETVARSAAEGDFVVVDYVGSLAGSGEDRSTPFPGGEGRDQLVELGAGNLLAGFEEGLVGTSAGEDRTLELTFPADYAAAELAGREASFQVTVKEVKRKLLPALDEDLVVDAGFDSLQELREDIRERLLELERHQVAAEFRAAALDAAVAQAQVGLTPALVQARAKEMWERMLHSLSHRGISREAYLQIAGREEREILAELEDDAERALRREAVLTAIVAAEGIEPSEEELTQALAPLAEREHIEPQKLFEELRARGSLDEVREDLAARKAVELIAARAVPIAPERAAAREKLWTPAEEPGVAELRGEQTGASREDADAAAAGSPRLWTPDR
jgi:trigger factor